MYIIIVYEQSPFDPDEYRLQLKGKFYLLDRDQVNKLKLKLATPVFSGESAASLSDFSKALNSVASATAGDLDRSKLEENAQPQNHSNPQKTTSSMTQIASALAGLTRTVVQQSEA